MTKLAEYPRVRAILYGLVGMAIGVGLYTLALDWWFLHSARVAHDQDLANQAALALLQQKQAQQGAAK